MLLYNDQPPCQCPEGPCPHYPYDIRGRLLEMRQGVSGLPRGKEIETLRAYTKAENPIIPIPEQIQRIGKTRIIHTRPDNLTSPTNKFPVEGIGTELTLILNSLGLKGYSGCKCKAIADWMNRIGLQECLDNRELILAKLRKAQKDLGWLDEKKAQFLGLIKGLAFKLDKNDPAPGLLDEAIRRWREKHPEGQEKHPESS